MFNEDAINFKISPLLTIICLIEMLVSRLAMYYVRAHLNDALTAGPNLTAFLSNVQIIQCWLELSNSNSPAFPTILKSIYYHHQSHLPQKEPPQ